MLINFSAIFQPLRSYSIPTFINFGRNVHQIWLLHPLCLLNMYMKNRLKFRFFKFLSSSILFLHIAAIWWNQGGKSTLRLLNFGKFSTQYAFSITSNIKFPPNRTIPYPTFINLIGNIHPIRLFHSLRLLECLE